MSALKVSTSSRRFANAAFSVARTSGDLDAWLATLDQLAAVVESPDSQRAFTNPTLATPEKVAALQQLVPGMSPQARNFVRILAERHRLGQLAEIAQVFREDVYRERGILTAQVTTAVPLDAQTQGTLAQRLGAYLHHDPAKLVFETRVDPEIIGGVVARVGDTLIDDSVRGRLDRLRRALTTAA